MASNKPPKLTKQNVLFCQYYVECGNATAAYVAAYNVSRETAGTAASRLLQDVRIQNRIAWLESFTQIKTSITIERLLREKAKIAFSDIVDIVSFAEGKVEIKDSKELSRDITATIKKFTVSRSYNQATRTEKVETTIELYDKNKALTELMQYMGLTSDYNTAIATLRKYGIDFYIDDNGNPVATRIAPNPSANVPQSTSPSQGESTDEEG